MTAKKTNSKTTNIIFKTGCVHRSHVIRTYFIFFDVFNAYNVVQKSVRSDEQQGGVAERVDIQKLC